MKRKTEKDYHEFAESRGFKWVGGVVPSGGVLSKTWWECEKKHRWEAVYNNIQQGTNCPICKRKTEKDYHKLAKSRGIKWAGSILPKTLITSTMWECKKGHRWKTTYDIIRRGSGCPICSGKSVKTEKDYHNLAKKRGFKWGGNVLPRNTRTKTWWECKKKHRWKTTYHNIQGGSGCYICKDMINGAVVSKPQIKLNNMLTGSLNYPESKYRIDVAIMRRSQKIAVEYDCWYWHQGKEKQEVKRDKFLISRGWKVLHVKAGEMLPTRKQMKRKINKLLKNKNVVSLYLKDWK